MNKIVAVIITYFSKAEIKKNVDSIIKQVNKIIIVDNGSDVKTISLLNSIKENYEDKVEIILNKENMGLDIAQNIGIVEALTVNPEWIMIFDDDSELNEDAVGNMLNIYNEINNCNINMIVPNVIERNIPKNNLYLIKKNRFIRKVGFGNNAIIRNVLTAIASGSLIKADYLKNHNLMIDSFFIDYIDIDFSLKMNMLGYEIIAVKNSELFHTLGNRTIKKVLGYSLTINNHFPFRKYYIYRNRIKIWKKYFKVYPVYVLYEILTSIYDFFRIIIFENNRKENILYILKGIKEGIFNND